MKFSSIINADRPTNLLIMKSFSSPSLEDDGIHLLPYAGLEYVVHLFDCADDLVRGLSKSPESFVLAHAESIRSLEDRVVNLEQGHKKMKKFVEDGAAVTAELRDFDENKRNEDKFIVSGLPRLQSGLTTKEWQLRVKRDVSGLIKKLLNREPPVQVVHNQTGSKPITTYLVQMEDSRDAGAVRQKFGAYFAGGKDARPSDLREVSIGNVITPASKVCEIFIRIGYCLSCLLIFFRFESVLAFSLGFAALVFSRDSLPLVFCF